ncbi:MAG: hypothetical protein KGL75_01275 [Acidobacteriota bacterium]|nr:hypothetical protein [Acidobacteriota bacterium]
MAKTLSGAILRFAAVAFCAFVLVAGVSRSAKANDMNHGTLVTFTSAVEVPGPDGMILLAPGTYVFEVAGTRGDNTVVQIFNEDITHLYATVLAIRSYRAAPGGTEFTLVQKAGESAQRIKTWFYRDNDHGQEFVYGE